MISYAQNGEDVVLERVFGGRDSGFYIDIGANDPVVDSVTLHFYRRGWRGINVEPAPGIFERLASHRPHDINLNVGLSNRSTVLTFYDMLSNQGLSTFTRELAELYRAEGTPLVERSIPVTTLASVCEAHCDRPIDFMKIDAEGHEPEILEGGDWSRWRPRVVVVEATLRPERGEHFLLGVNYHKALFDGLNCFYVRDEDRELLPAFSLPANIMDDYHLYRYLHVIEDMQAERLRLESRIRELEGQGQRVVDWEELGPIAKGVARRLRHLSVRNPKLSAAVKRLMYLTRAAG